MSQNLRNITFVAKKLASLKDDVVFVGGAVLELLLDESYQLQPRVSYDVDMVVEIASRIEYAKFEKKLRKLGFKHDTEKSDQNCICRWNIDGVVVDIMPTDESILSFSNRWYKALYQQSQKYLLTEHLSINLVTAPYLLATKFEAFYDRGKGDYYGSHDLEDIVTLLDGRETLAIEIKQSDSKLYTYLQEKLAGLMKNGLFLASLPGHLAPYGANVSDRIKKINNVLNLISNTS